MARFYPNLGIISGTYQEQTFVKSARYGVHLRSKRGTHRPAVLNEMMQASSIGMGSASGAAKLVFDQVRHVHKDGGLWPKLVSVFKQQLGVDGGFGVGNLKGLECSEDHSFAKLAPGFMWRVVVAQNAAELGISCVLSDRPRFLKKQYLDGYQLTVRVMWLNFETGFAQTDVHAGPVTGLDDAVRVLAFSVGVPNGAKAYVVLLQLDGCVDGVAEGRSVGRAMMVAAVGDVEVAEGVVERNGL